MVEQPVALRRCASCARWSGPRTASTDGHCVGIAEETVSGLCQGGPWDGSERRARSACGHWRRWPELPGHADGA